jgi:hypothetical protein
VNLKGALPVLATLRHVRSAPWQSETFRTRVRVRVQGARAHRSPRSKQQVERDEALQEARARHHRKHAARMPHRQRAGAGAHLVAGLERMRPRRCARRLRVLEKELCTRGRSLPLLADFAV